MSRIADAARSLPYAVRPVDVGDDALAELEVLIGCDDALASEATRISNRIRGLLTGIHPALEHAIGSRISHPAVPEIPSRSGGSAAIAKAGRRKLTAIAKVHDPASERNLVEAITAELGEQTVTVPGTAAAGTVLPRLAPLPASTDSSRPAHRSCPQPGPPAAPCAQPVQ